MSENKKLTDIIDIGDGISFKDDWNKRAELLGADTIATLGPESLKLTGEHFSYVVAKRILYLTEMRKQDRVMELGCGPGKIAYWMSSHAYSITGVDVSDVMLKHARERCNSLINLNFVQNNGQDLSEFKSESQDIIYSFACFIHLPIDIQQAYESEILRVLRPGGVSLLHVRHNQTFSKVIRTYSGASYNQERIDSIRGLPEVASVDFFEIERCDDLVENLDHRRWIRIRKR